MTDKRYTLEFYLDPRNPKKPLSKLRFVVGDQSRELTGFSRAPIAVLAYCIAVTLAARKSSRLNPIMETNEKYSWVHSLGLALCDPTPPDLESIQEKGAVIRATAVRPKKPSQGSVFFKGNHDLRIFNGSPRIPVEIETDADLTRMAIALEQLNSKWIPIIDPLPDGLEFDLDQFHLNVPVYDQKWNWRQPALPLKQHERIRLECEFREPKDPYIAIIEPSGRIFQVSPWALHRDKKLHQPGIQLERLTLPSDPVEGYRLTDDFAGMLTIVIMLNPQDPAKFDEIQNALTDLPRRPSYQPEESVRSWSRAEQLPAIVPQKMGLDIDKAYSTERFHDFLLNRLAEIPFDQVTLISLPQH